MKKIISVGMVVCIGSWSVTGCSSNSPAPVTETGPAITVSLLTASHGTPYGINVSGHVESSEAVAVSTKIMGYITMLKVKEGDNVKKGQLLATISNQDMLARRAQTDAMIAETQAAVENAGKDHERFTILYRQQSATAKELENVELQYTAAKAKLNGAREMRKEINANLAYSGIIAPFDGIVTQKMVEAGSMANPGAPLMVISKNGHLRVSATVPESSIGAVQKGAPATIHIQAAGKSIQAAVSQVVPSSSITGGQYTVKLEIPAGESLGLFAGMYADVIIKSLEQPASKSSSKAVLVPLTSICHNGQLTGLFTVSNANTALLRWVRLGRTHEDKVEVLSGLEKNEAFIAYADPRLYNGAPVQVDKKD